MPEQTASKELQLFAELITKQAAIFGRDITLAQLHTIPELRLDAAGNLAGFSGDPQEIAKKLLDAWQQLSPFLAKKIAYPLINR